MEYSSTNHQSAEVSNLSSCHSPESVLLKKDERMDTHSHIAIVGMGIRLSGGVTTPNEFWTLLMEGKNGLCQVPSTRYAINAFHAPGKQQSVKTRKGYFLKEDPDLFDADFFGINPKEVERMDPQQRHLLEVTAECLEDAGETALRGTKVGCFVGVFGEDWLSLSSQDPQTVDRYYASSTGHFALSNRISYQFDWHGPSLTIQTACSSSMVSLHEACQSLLRNDCNAAVVGGVNLILSPTMTMAMSDSKVLAADGVCKTFDAAADGYGRGEGVTVILIKRLQDAIQNNDNIRAVIRATSTNFDGKTPSASAPDVDRQESLIRQTYQRAGLSNIGETAFFECHGTGTQIGDIVEVTAITRVLQGDNLDPGLTWIGSVKPNVGHTEGASGLTSIIKAALCLENDIIPPNVFFNTPNPKIPFQAANLSVPLEPQPFPAGRKKRVSVNSFGVGGSNAHAILDSAGSFLSCSVGPLQKVTQAGSSNQRYLLVLSAKHPDVLEKRIASIVEYKNTNGDCSLSDLSYTLCCRREHYGHRAFAIASSQRPLSRADFRASHLPSGPQAVTVWLFTGQGAQWVGMAQRLLTNSTEFQNDMEHLEVALRLLPDAPEWNIREELAKSASEGSRINETQISQPLSTAIAIGLVNQLRRWGITPSAVIGHSSGEIAAAYAAGAISAASAISMAYYRGLVSKLREGEGAMVSIGLGWMEVRSYLQQVTDVVIACRNSPRSTVLSGSAPGLEKVINLVKQEHPHVSCRKLRVTVPYHSPQMRDVSALYEQRISDMIQHTDSMVPMYSTVLLEKITYPAKLDASYWGRGLVSPVQFSQAIEHACSDSGDSQLIFLEIGAHATFFGFIKQITEEGGAGSGRMPIYIPTLTRNDPDASAQLLSAVGRLHSLGIAPDMPSVTGVRNVLCNLPLYPWTHRRYRHESRLARDWRLRAAPHHELLGSRMTAMSDLEPAWRNLLQVGDVLWISDHVLDGKVIFPVAGYITMAGAACMQLRNHSDSFSVRNLVLHSFLTLLPGKQLEVLTSLRKSRYNDLMESEWYTFSVSSYDGTGWTNHCDGQVRAECGNGATENQECGMDSPPYYSRKVNAAQWYQSARKRGYAYGQSFQGLDDITADPVEIAAIGTTDETVDPNEDAVYVIHPTVIDRCLQLMGVAQGHGLSRRLPGLQVPKSIESVFIAKNGPKTTFSVRGIDDGNQSLLWNAFAWSDGREVLSIRNMRSVAVSSRLKAAKPIPSLTSLRWSPLLDLLPLSEPHLLTKGCGNIGEPKHPWSKFLELLGHSRPPLRILELGVAAPVLTNSNLEQLRTNEGTRLFSSYTLTSASTVALDLPKLEFDSHPGVNFKVFNAQGDLSSQGLEAHSFDLVVTSDSTYLLSQAALVSIRQLLAPCGWLLVQNAASDKVIKEDVQSDEATTSQTTRLRNELLQTAGLQCLEELMEKDVESGIMKLTLLAKAAQQAPLPSTDITLLSSDNRCALANNIASELVEQGHNVTWSILGELPAPQQRIISFLDFDGPALATLSELKFQQLKNYLLSSQSAHVLWLTKSTQSKCKDPRYGLVHGFLRSLRQECGLDLFVLQLDEGPTSSAKMVTALHSWIEQVSKHESKRQDFDFAIINGKIQVGRYHWISTLPRPVNRLLPAEPHLKLKLDSDLSSDLHCTWVTDIDAGLQEDHIQIDIRYVGLNFRDILVATGRIGNKDKLGIEASGIIRRVGSKVHEYEVGDRVGVLGSGLCQTRVNSPAASCWKLPQHLSLDAAASSLVPFLTALYSLVHVGGLRKDQSVLVHSACGGVGLAAIQICQLLGAKIYATVGNSYKAEYLETHFLLPRKHIFNSRDDSFLANLMEATGGKGVDVVLNSLAGKLLHASWECVASFGKMIELGKIDFSTHGLLSMGPFAKNRAFIGVDLLQLGSERPEILISLLGEVRGYFETGQLSALPLQGEYDASAAPRALRQMQAGQHIGRFVLRIPADRSGLPLSTDLPDVCFRSDASYLLVGGTGGLGRAVSNWMVEHGAKELVYMSRTAQQTAEDDNFVRELAVQGCKAVFVDGSVVDVKDVRRAIAACREPLRGVIQLSAVLRDRTFGNMTYEEWTECLGPKVTGTWHLHDALQDQPNLDFFVVFGSLAGVYGNGGQSNYAAANTYLESFVHYRRQLGLPCSLLNLGPVEDAGMLRRDDKLLLAMRATSVQFLSEADVCKGLGIAVYNSPVTEADEFGHTEQAVLSSPAVVNLGMSASKDVSELSSRALWINDARFALYTNLESNSTGKPSIVDDQFRMFMARVEENPTILNQPETELVVCREIARLMTGYLGFGEKISDEDIGNIAIDSLMAIEIKDWMRGNMNLDVSMDQTSRARTSGELASHTMDRLKVKYGLVKE